MKRLMKSLSLAGMVLVGTASYATNNPGSEIVDFRVVKNDDIATITWVVKQELDEVSYIVERSIRGGEFSEVAVKKGFASYYDVLFVVNDTVGKGEVKYRLRAVNNEATVYVDTIDLPGSLSLVANR